MAMRWADLGVPVRDAERIWVMPRCCVASTILGLIGHMTPAALASTVRDAESVQLVQSLTATAGSTECVI
jgi:hypothetical protein